MKKKIFTLFVVGAMIGVLSFSANAITIGKWDVSGITNRIQQIAKEQDKDENPSDTPNYPVNDATLEQIYAAKRAQIKSAIDYWRSR